MEIQYPNNRLRELVDVCWNMYDRLHCHDFVVRPAIPILFFGDSHRYFSSSLRVISVGLNPSKLEFPDDGPMSRFAHASKMACSSDQRDDERYLAALNAYFRPTSRPYKSWFASFEPILNGVGASFYDAADCTALHTDLCSPLATNPTWSKLSAEKRALLESDGVSIWHSLAETLAPDVILVSIAKRYCEQIRFPIIAPTEALWQDTGRPYVVRKTLLQINSKRSLMVFGTAAQTPFGTVSSVKKRAIGKMIKEQCNVLAR